MKPQNITHTQTQPSHKEYTITFDRFTDLLYLYSLLECDLKQCQDTLGITNDETLRYICSLDESANIRILGKIEELLFND